jgi:hypothetical protein
MAIRRRPTSPYVIVPMIKGTDALYEVDLTAAPSPEWRAAFRRPPARLTSARYTPDVGRVTIREAAIHFRSAPEHLHLWHRRIDRWIAYANSIAEESRVDLDMR